MSEEGLGHVPDDRASEDYLGVAEEVLDQAIAVLGIGTDASALRVKGKLQRVARDFRTDRLAATVHGTPKAQRLAIQRLRVATEKTLAALSEVAPEYAVTLDSLSDEAAEPGPITLEVERLLLALHNAAVLFDEHYQPKIGRSGDVALEEATRGLAEIVAEVTGKFPVPALNKSKGTAPELVSPGAKAVGLILRSVDFSIPEATIANMLEKVRTLPATNEHHLDALLELQMMAEHRMLEDRQDVGEQGDQAGAT